LLSSGRRGTGDHGPWPGSRAHRGDFGLFGGEADCQLGGPVDHTGAPGWAVPRLLGEAHETADGGEVVDFAAGGAVMSCLRNRVMANFDPIQMLSGRGSFGSVLAWVRARWAAMVSAPASRPGVDARSFPRHRREPS
jgi:hypothetical protein